MSNRKISAAFLLMSLLTTSIATAGLSEDLSLSAFVAPTGIHTSDNNFFGDTDDSVSGQYMEVGLIGRYNFTENLSFVAEGLYKGVGASESKPNLDFAFLDYKIYQDFDHTFGVRVGKLKVPYGLYNDTRDVPFTRSRIFLPQSIYFENFRDSSFSQEGIEIRGEHIYNFGMINWNAGLTESIGSNREVNSLYSGASDLANFEGEKSGYFRIMYTNPASNFVGAISYATAGYDVESKMPMFLQSGVARHSRGMLSLEYTPIRSVVLTTEIEYNEWDFNKLDSPFMENDHGMGYYVQGLYKLNPEWDMFVSYGETWNNSSDRDGEDYASTSPFMIPAHQRFTKDVTVGVGYRPNNNCMIRMEYSNFVGTSILPGEFNSDEPTSKHWDMIAIQASYRFDIL